MREKPRLALLLGAVPFLMLVFALPLVNRIEPVILGLPFILFWILIWVALTPLVLFAAYRLEKKNGPPDSGRSPGLARGAEGRSTCPWFQATGKWRAEGSSLDDPEAP